MVITHCACEYPGRAFDEVRHAGLRLCKEIVTNRTGIVGCSSATKKKDTHSHQGIRNVAEEGKHQEILVLSGLYEEKPETYPLTI